ncbi:C-type lectin domain family 10 member A-like [Archocentrus centrarchus]|uniref:C-type lectin domain family 10 member A-like n=1 Tax=Archocentrus centrarchus TaxID=63155 RepID=UPI0011E9C01D|nr:C-type lectin domain family 10 member A-like [Archocentrus centrarchus]
MEEIYANVDYSKPSHPVPSTNCTDQDSATELSAMNNILSFMTEERDLLHANLTEKTKELERLQSLAKQKKTCPSRWSMVGCSCYRLSERSGTWDQGRKDCRDKGADLAVIDSAEEQNFLASLTSNPAWIGLNDKEEEGTWKWIDGTPLTVKYWESSQPDNGGGSLRWGEEDCAHIRTPMSASWNDFSCESSLPWVCEKIL